MRIELQGESDLTLREFDEPAIEIEVEHPDAEYSALEMFATSLGLCTASVLVHWGQHHDLDSEGLEVRVRWWYAEEPLRVKHFEMDIDWPEVPDNLLESARRVAASCTIHNTLHQPPQLVTRVAGREAQAS